MKQLGAIVISLDLELLWGVFDKIDYKKKQNYFCNTRNVIPKLLELFNEFNIHCTWATVGMLFNKDWLDWNENFPKEIPVYSNEKLSAYSYGKKYQSADTEKLSFAPELLNRILHTPGQEIGTHTYSHYYCLEEGQTITSFKADLEKAIELAKKQGINIRSLVFPRNQFNDEYLKVCYELGIENVRSNPTNWYWENTQKDSLVDKIFRTGDAYIGIKDKSYGLDKLYYENGKPLSQKASRLLRPYSPNKFYNDLKLNRIKSEMTAAAKKKEIYHLWWHPHNFGDYPTENLADLKIILQHFKICKSKYGFSSLNMAEVNDLLKVNGK